MWPGNTDLGNTDLGNTVMSDTIITSLRCEMQAEDMFEH